MNTMNQEDMTRYVDEKKCDYLIERRLKKQVERDYLQDPDFRVVLSLPFLDATETPFPYRSFYIGIDDYEKHMRYDPYYLLRRVRYEEDKEEIQIGKEKVVLQSSEDYLSEEVELWRVCCDVIRFLRGVGKWPVSISPSLRV